MRSRKPRNSESLPTAFHANEAKQPRRKCRIILRVAALALAVTWASSLYVKSASSSSESAKDTSLKKRLDSSTSDESSPTKVVKPKDSHHKKHHSHSHSHKKHKEDKKDRKSGSTHTKKSDEKPVCTPSPLEQRQAYPMYGCDDLKVSLVITGDLLSRVRESIEYHRRRVCLLCSDDPLFSYGVIFGFSERCNPCAQLVHRILVYSYTYSWRAAWRYAGCISQQNAYQCLVQQYIHLVTRKVTHPLG